MKQKTIHFATNADKVNMAALGAGYGAVVALIVLAITWKSLPEDRFTQYAARWTFPLLSLLVLTGGTSPLVVNKIREASYEQVLAAYQAQMDEYKRQIRQEVANSASAPAPFPEAYTDAGVTNSSNGNYVTADLDTTTMQDLMDAFATTARSVASSNSNSPPIYPSSNPYTDARNSNQASGVYPQNHAGVQADEDDWLSSEPRNPFG